MSKSKLGSRVLSSLLALLMIVSVLPVSAFAADMKAGTATVPGYNYEVRAKVTVTDGKISDVALSHDAEKDHPDSVIYANQAITGLKGKFDGISATDKDAILAVDTVSHATITSEAYKEAVVKALGLNTVDLTFGSANKALEPGMYVVPISLRMADKHESESKACSAFPATGRLYVAEDGSAVLETAMKSVTIGPISDMAYGVTYYKEDNYTSKEYPVTEMETNTFLLQKMWKCD